MNPAETTIPFPRLTRAVIAATGVAALWLAWAALRQAAEVRGHAGDLVAVLGAIALLAWLARRTAWLTRVSAVAFVTAAAAVFVVTRLGVVLLMPTEPASDFATYLHMARLFADGPPLPPAGPFAYFTAWGYPLALAPWFAVFGSSLRLAQLLNIAAGAATLPLLYLLAHRAAGPAAACVAAVLFVLWPAQALYTSVPASEHLAMLLAVGGLVLALGRRDAAPGGASLALGCVVLALAAAVRPALGVLLPCAAVVVLLMSGTRRQRATRAAVLLGGYALVSLSWSPILQRVYGQPMPSAVWWNLMVGLNHASTGAWNAEDAGPYFTQPTVAEANRHAREIIRRRLAASPAEHASLVRRKVRRLWADGCYGLNWATLRMTPGPAADRVTAHRRTLAANAQLAQAALLAAAAVGLLAAARRSACPSPLLLCLLVVLAGTALHATFESQARYHHVFAAGLLVWAAVGLGGWRDAPGGAPPAVRPTRPTDPA
jgi:hypothetical protein